MTAWRHVVASGLLLLAVAGCQPEGTGQRPAPGTPASAQTATGPVEFVDGYRAGFERAIREGKPMLVYFTAPWCLFCQEMNSEAFTEQAVARLASRFVCIRVDATAEPEVCQQFQVRGFPTVQFLSPVGMPLNRTVGKQPAPHLVLEMQTALHTVARRQHLSAQRL